MNIVNPKLKFRGQLVKRSQTTTIVLHHAEARKATVQDIHAWHLANGWAGIGYHYYIRKDGTIYQVRPEWALGSHCKGSNYNSIGVCCEGDYEKLDINMPPKQYNALIGLINDIESRNGKLQIKGHDELYPTQCPGKYYPLARIKKLFNNAVLKPTTIAKTEQSKSASIDLKTNFGVQAALKILGFYEGAIDGIVGSKTVNAILVFQKKYGLNPDGIAGPITKAKLKELIK